MTTRIFATLDHTLPGIESRDGNWPADRFFDGDERPSAVAVDPGGPDIRIVTTPPHAGRAPGLYRSTDAGDAWDELDVTRPDDYRGRQPRAVAATTS